MENILPKGQKVYVITYQTYNEMCIKECVVDEFIKYTSYFVKYKDSCFAVSKDNCFPSLKEATKEFKKRLYSNIKVLKEELLNLTLKHDKLEEEISEQEMKELGILK